MGVLWNSILIYQVYPRLGCMGIRPSGYDQIGMMSVE